MRRFLVPLLLLVALVAGGCGKDGTTSNAAAPEPRRIVSLSPTATEMLFAIGAGGQVVAVDSNSNYPAEAPKTELSAYKPNIEAIAGYKPDLVVYSDDPGELKAGLDKLSIPALKQPAATTPRRHLRPARPARQGHRPRGRGRPAGRHHADRDRQDRRRRPARAAADLLPRAGQEPVLGHLQDLHRPAVRPARHEEHRRRGRQAGQRLPAAVGRVRRSRPTPT